MDEFTQFFILMLVAASATCLSYAVLYLKNRIQSTFFEYLFAEILSTSASFSVQATTALSLIDKTQTLGIKQVVTMFLSAYMIDSIVNKCGKQNNNRPNSAIDSQNSSPDN